MRIPNLNTLNTFNAAARHLNFRLAAEELNITRGAVAQQIRQLEDDIGFPLFFREARGLALTKVGAKYHIAINQALTIIQEATHELHAQNTKVILSVPPSVASKWLMPKLPSFMQSNPGIDIQTIASEGLANFKSDHVDIAIRQGNPPFADYLCYRLLSPLDLCAVCCPSYAESVAKINRISDFAAYQLIQDGHKHWQTEFEKSGVNHPETVLNFNLAALAIDAATSGLGIALVPKILVAAELKHGKLVKLWDGENSTQNGFYLLYTKQKNSNDVAKSMVIDWLLTKANSL